MSFLTVDRQAPSSKDKPEETKENNEDLEVDNSKSVLLKIATLYAEQLMSDLTLEVAGVGYPAHRLILCASSEVFQVHQMFEAIRHFLWFWHCLAETIKRS